jgi:hypothetical protein
MEHPGQRKVQNAREEAVESQAADVDEMRHGTLLR